MAALVCEVALHLKQQGLTLGDYLDEIERQIGVYRDVVVNVEMPATVEGMAQMKSLMERVRASHPKSIGKRNVLWVADYLRRTRKNLQTGQEEAIVLPQSDVLQFGLENRCSVVVRPSGTEPKIKIYASAAVDAGTDLEAAREAAVAEARVIADALKATLVGSA